MRLTDVRGPRTDLRTGHEKLRELEGTGVLVALLGTAVRLLRDAECASFCHFFAIIVLTQAIASVYSIVFP